MSRFALLIAWLDGQRHLRTRGHLPSWYDMGATGRECLNCITKGGGPRGGRQWMPALVPRALPL